MKDEIKEKIKAYYIGNDIDEILDYITNLQKYYNDNLNKYEELLVKYSNLQKENEILKENAIHNDKVVDEAKWNEMLYKSRNEKAREYIKNKQELNKMFGTITLSKDSQNELLNILGGDDNDF